MLKPNDPRDEGGRWGLWEVASHEARDLMNGIGIRALLKEALESCLAPSTKLEGAVYEPGRWPSLDTKSAKALTLNFQPAEL